MSSQQSQPNNEAEKEVLVELIESLKENRCLWDTKCDAYANRDLRRAAHGSLLEIYKKFQPNATIDLLKKKIENLKCSFRRELRKVRASETTGAGSSQIYTPRLWFYELMSFLEEKEMIREGLDTLEEDESQMDAVETVGDPGSGAAVVQKQSDQRQNAGPSTIVNPAGARAPIPRKRKMSALDKKKEAMFDSVQNLLSATEAEWEVIGKSLGLQLSQLNNDQQTIAQKLIADIIFYGKREKLTDMSCINLAPNSSPHFFQTPLSSFQSMHDNHRFKRSTPPFPSQKPHTLVASPSPPFIPPSPSSITTNESNISAQDDYNITELNSIQNPRGYYNPDHEYY